MAILYVYIYILLNVITPFLDVTFLSYIWPIVTGQNPRLY